MKLKVLTTALVATVLSLLITETAEAQGRGYYNRGRNCGNGYSQGYRGGGGWNSWVPVPPLPRVSVQVNGCGPRGYVRSYAPGCNNGYYGRGRYRGGYNTTYTTTTTYYNNNNGYYGGGYNNGYYNNGGGNCGNGYRRW